MNEDDVKARNKGCSLMLNNVNVKILIKGDDSPYTMRHSWRLFSMMMRGMKKGKIKEVGEQKAAQYFHIGKIFPLL